MNVQRYKVGYYSDEWGMSSNTPCLLKDDSGYAVKFEDYEQLRQRVQELEQQLTDVRQSERERCAKVCEELRHPDGYSGENVDWCAGTDHSAAAIRAME